MENTHSFYATLTANVFVSDEDFYFIYDCFQKHYDHKLQYAAEVGGWLYGRKVRRTPYADWTPSDEDRVIEFTFRQMDSILKSMEMQQTEQASKIYLRFSKIMGEMNTSQKTINKNISGWSSELNKN